MNKHYIYEPKASRKEAAVGVVLMLYSRIIIIIITTCVHLEQIELSLHLPINIFMHIRKLVWLARAVLT